MRGALVTLVLVPAALGACGGGDDASDVERVLRDYARAANERDGEKFCGELVTQEFVEQITQARGENAREQCRDLLKVTQRGLTIKIVEIEDVEIEGDRATADATIETERRKMSQRFFLRKQDGDFRLTTNPRQ